MKWWNKDTFFGKYAWIFIMLILTLLPGLLWEHYDPFFYFPWGIHLSTLIFFSSIGFLVFLAIESTDFKFSKLGFDFSHIGKDIIFAVLALLIILPVSVGSGMLFDNYSSQNVKEFALDPSNNFKAKVIAEEPSLLDEDISQSYKFLEVIILLISLVIFISAEEIARLFIFIKTEASWGVWVAFFISALFFGFWHLTKSSGSGFSAFVGGMLLTSLWLVRGRRIVAPIIAHVLINFLPELFYTFYYV
ncbi:CPBP family intramembrane metalloprotease [archaeon]|jgi:membrane protease YdiL (CAAX protease family)|nr:CPBP family intramembrane metalloprotease [archaeon]